MAPGKARTEAQPFAMGALMGHQLAMAKVMTPERMLLLTRAIRMETKPLTPAEKCETEKKAKMLFEKTVPAINTAAKQALAGAVNLPSNEMAEFMHGFEAGTKGASFESFKAHLDFTTKVYLILILGWQAVEKLGSVTELRN